MLYPANQARAFFDNDTYQLGEDLTVVAETTVRRRA